VKITRHLLASVLKLGQLSVYVPRERWDANPDILVFSNGTLEISERRFREHKTRRLCYLSLTLRL